MLILPIIPVEVPNKDKASGVTTTANPTFQVSNSILVVDTRSTILATKTMNAKAISVVCLLPLYPRRIIKIIINKTAPSQKTGQTV